VEVCLAARAFVVAVSTPILVRLDLGRLQRWLEPRRKTSLGGDARAAATHVEWITNVVLHRARRIVRPGCMARGLTRYAVMRRADIDVVLCFGVGRPKDDFEGHCWLTLDDEVLFEPSGSEESFTRVVGISGAGVA
jgi:hypothetical protein